MRINTKTFARALTSLALAALLVSVFGTVPVSAQTTWYVDVDTCPEPGSGTEAEPFCEIQDAINEANPGDTIIVAPGTYEENLIIDGKHVTLLSQEGRDQTTIQPSGTQINAIELRGSTAGIRIGDEGQGFTIVGAEPTNQGVETAALYIKGNHSDIQVDGNEIAAGGDSAILTEWGATVSGFAITRNVISGQTFVGDNPAGQGTADQWTLFNVPRSLVYIGGPEKANVTFTYNQVTGVAGGINDQGDPQGNQVVNIDADGATITDNYFSGDTAWTAATLRARGTDTVIEDNQFESGAVLSVHVFLGDDTVVGGAEHVQAHNDFDKSALVYENPLRVNIVFATIGAAVGAAQPGDTVQVYAGTYGEAVVIDKSLTLSGAGPDQVLLDMSELTDERYGIEIRSSDVTVEGLKVVGHKQFDWDSAGIGHDGYPSYGQARGAPASVANVQVKNVVVETHHDGIKFRGVSGNRSSNITIDDVVVSDCIDAGLKFDYVEDSTIRNAQSHGHLHHHAPSDTVRVNEGSAVEIRYSDSILLENVEVWDSQRGFLIWRGGTHTLNDCIARDLKPELYDDRHDATYGGNPNADGFKFDSNVTIYMENATSLRNPVSGMRARDTNLMIVGGDFSEHDLALQGVLDYRGWNKQRAISLERNTIAEIQDVTFADNQLAVAVDANTAADQIEVNYCNIDGNDIGVLNAHNDVVDATCNWWGHPCGPTHGSNPQGEGDVVSDNVDFTPWSPFADPEEGKCIDYCPGDLNVVKQLDGDAECEAWSFAVEGPDLAEAFPLGDGETWESGMIQPGTYTVTETDTCGCTVTFEVDSIDGGTGPEAVVELEEGESITVTFTNSDCLPPEPVGGLTQPTDVAGLLLPWLALAGLFILGVSAFLYTRRNASVS